MNSCAICAFGGNQTLTLLQNCDFLGLLVSFVNVVAFKRRLLWQVNNGHWGDTLKEGKPNQ